MRIVINLLFTHAVYCAILRICILSFACLCGKHFVFLQDLRNITIEFLNLKSKS